MKEPMQTLCSALVYGCLLFHLCGGQCPGDGTLSPVLDDKVAESDVVVQGQVLRQVKAEAWDTSYTAELSVLCVYKGGPVPSLINVTRAGMSCYHPFIVIVIAVFVVDVVTFCC